jgi:hypothetical protein
VKTENGKPKLHHPFRQKDGEQEIPYSNKDGTSAGVVENLESSVKLNHSVIPACFIDLPVVAIRHAGKKSKSRIIMNYLNLFYLT